MPARTALSLIRVRSGSRASGWEGIWFLFWYSTVDKVIGVKGGEAPGKKVCVFYFVTGSLSFDRAYGIGGCCKVGDCLKRGPCKRNTILNT
jgi:hypothetical protein